MARSNQEPSGGSIAIASALAASEDAVAHGAAWAEWRRASGRRYTIGVEEEVMLLDAADLRPAPRGDAVLLRLSEAVREHASPETHAAVLELSTGIHHDVAGAVAELSALRQGLAGELRELGLAAASAGVHPLGSAEGMAASRAPRYRALEESLRSLARREPTMALHVHVGIPEPEEAVRVYNALLENAATLLALSSNSPFTGGRDSGFDSARAMIFRGFPRTGTPRPFPTYTEYVAAIAPLVDSGALAGPTFFWWDVRLQPALGTVEVRVMDAQTTIDDTAGIVALVQSLARSALEDEQSTVMIAPEILEENRFLAARDGLGARLLDPVTRTLVAVRSRLRDLLSICCPHATALGCETELDQVRPLAAANGAMRQRIWALQRDGARAIMPVLVERFAPARSLASAALHRNHRDRAPSPVPRPEEE